MADSAFLRNIPNGMGTLASEIPVLNPTDKGSLGIGQLLIFQPLNLY
jgi:hypothetical protein